MALLTLTGKNDYSDDTLSGITRIVVGKGSQTTVDSSQFDDEQIAGNVKFEWGLQETGTVTSIEITGSIDASNWRFGYFDPNIWFLGTEGSDKLTGTSRGDRISISTSPDAAKGDIVSGGGGDDVLFGSGISNASHCRVSGDEGNDSISGWFTNSTLKGGDGDDNFDISGSGNLIFGGLGNDLFSGVLVENNRFLGGLGDDSFVFALLGEGKIFGGFGNDIIQMESYGEEDLGDVLVSGGMGDDGVEISSVSGHFRLFGGEGNDVIYLDCYETVRGFIEGGEGDDRIIAHGINVLTDHIEGGLGNDWIDVSGEKISGFIDGGDGLDGLTISLYGHVESIIADFTNPDTIHRFGNLKIVGFEAVEIYCGSGDDHILGSMAGDKLWGGFGDDTLDGNASGDWLDGGAGHNVLTGGSGKDVFVASYVESGESIVTDFAQGVDQLNFGFWLVNPAPVFIGTAGFSGAGNYHSEIRYEHVDGHTIVISDSNGDGIGDRAIELATLVNLTVEDFVML